MTVKYVAPSMELIVGPAAARAGELAAAMVGQRYFEDDTGLYYRKSGDGATWIAEATGGVTTADLDTGAGTATRAVVGIVVASSGGPTNLAGGTGVDGAGVQRVSLATDIPLPAGTNLIGKAGIDQTTPGSTNAVVATTPIATTNVLTPDVDFGTVTKKSVKGSAGNLHHILAYNLNSALRYLQLHNKASAPAGADVPIESWPIPAGAATAPGLIMLGEAELGVAGERCSTGVAWAISTTKATFTDSATASDHGVSLRYL